MFYKIYFLKQKCFYITNSISIFMQGFNLFFKKTARILLYLLEKNHIEKRSCNITEISRELNLNFGWTRNVLKNMEQMGLVKSEKKGRDREFHLTKRGLKIAKEVNEVEKRLQNK